MIKLTKGARPQVLEDRGHEWTAEFTSYGAGPLPRIPKSVRYRYRDKSIKDAVKRDSFGKCIYCDSTVLQVYPGDIEHILPVSKRAELVVDWKNLAFVCNVCNAKKRDYYEPNLPLLNPYEDDPSEHLAFYGPVILHRVGAERGEVTVRRLKLNDLDERPALFERRKEHIESLQQDMDRIAGLAAGPLRDALEADLHRRLADSEPYAATAREFVKQARSADS